MEEKELRRFSRVVVDGVEQAPSRAMLRAVGFEEEDFNRPQIGIASTWSMITPCNMHIRELARKAGEGADEAGGKSVIFNTITVSDGIAMGTPGMRYSLVSREIIADSIEAVAGAGLHGHDRCIGQVVRAAEPTHVLPGDAAQLLGGHLELLFGLSIPQPRLPQTLDHDPDRCERCADLLSDAGRQRTNPGQTLGAA